MSTVKSPLIRLILIVAEITKYHTDVSRNEKKSSAILPT